MPTKEVEIPKITFINNNGEEIEFKVKALSLTNSMDDGRFDKSINFNYSKELKLISESSKTDLFITNEIFKSVPEISEFTILKGFRKIQNRTHKKKRINKKYAKKYGYRKVGIYKTVKCDKFEIKSEDIDVMDKNVEFSFTL